MRMGNQIFNGGAKALIMKGVQNELGFEFSG
jgi:hypothetical protein